MPRRKVEKKVDVPKIEDDEEEDAGGFIVDDPDLRTKRRKVTAKATAKPPANTRQKRQTRTVRSTTSKASHSDKEDEADDVSDNDDDDDDDDGDDDDFVLDEHIEKVEADVDDDDLVIISGRSVSNNSSSFPIYLSDGDADSDTPLAQLNTPPAKKPRKPRKKKAADDKPKIKLTPFQRRSNKVFGYHPDLAEVFEKLSEMPTRKVEKAVHPEGMTITLLPFQLEGLSWMIKQEDESGYNGGILADEMGMGKTIQMISLMMHDRSKGPNLVVAPTVALIQWKNEIETHAGGRLKVAIFHGSNRAKTLDDLSEYDVIMTTYAVLESGFRKEKYGFKRNGRLVKEKSLLHKMKFYRVILDEAHNIKDRQSSTAKAANVLNCEKRWCLSGTPLQNRIGELYSLIRFLDIAPFCEYLCTQCNCRSKEWLFPDYKTCAGCGHRPMSHMNFFNHFMLKNIQKYGLSENEGVASFERIQSLLRQIMLRRTKVERADDLGLPPKIVEIRRDFFNPEEKDLYQSLYSDSKRTFNDYVAQGVVLNNYANIFTLITRMRQLADHPDLVLKRFKSNQQSSIDLINSGVIVCQLCDDEAEEPIESKCHHKFCRICITEYNESFNGDTSKLECPVCHIGLSIDLEAPALELNQTVVEKGSIVNRINMSSGDWRSSTKIEALMEELYKSRSDRQTTKSIVFSQFTSMLDLVEWRLKRAGFSTVKLQGSMTPIQRDSTIKHFMNNPSVEVFLVSLKAGGVALNLVEASQVFILDSWWNPALDTGQAADRIHRIGQHRPIKIVKLVIEDSIESRIIELQEKKSNMVKATLDKDQGAASRLSATDMQFLFNN
ncbi:hypothetical protein CANARDRAFT_197201 [[Candida] arabinofermentans NRRL YB-2248]|uniref:DNA repair protein RAD16 n=1 Tax=[Candida] arabinofermentans NRRL YB-2248 TaxID=983967 RepID=A0A1E4T337_9ASCO|nr:hypothetical protein CANARDRAFT_197201 [[Candida] arabinofermentans NRRL YB-2248]